MNQDPYAMTQEIVELQTRVSELSAALERVTEQRDNALDTAESMHAEMEAMRLTMKTLGATVDRLRTHINQGLEL